MSNIIPPLVNSSPPPMVAGEPDDLDDDEFGDFAVANHSYEGYSLPTTPQHVSYTNYPSVCNINTFVTHTESVKQDNIQLNDSVTVETSQSSKNQDQNDEILSVKYISSIDANGEESKNIFCDIKTDVHIEQKSVNIYEKNFGENHINLLSNPMQDTETKVDEIVSETNETTSDQRDSQNGTNKKRDDCFGEFTSGAFSLETNDYRQFSEQSCTQINLDESSVSETVLDVNNLTLDDTVISQIEEVKNVEENRTSETETNEESKSNGVNQNLCDLDFNGFESEDSDFGNFENVTVSQQSVSEDINFKPVFEESRNNRLENDEDSLSDFGVSTVDESEHSKDIFNGNENKLINTDILQNVTVEVNSEPGSVDKSQLDDFGDFESGSAADVKVVSEFSSESDGGESKLHDEELEISDFKQYEHNNSGRTQRQENLDDFGDFSDYSTQDENLALSINVAGNTNDKLANIEKIIKSSFSCEECTETDIDYVDFKDNDVFKEIQDLENTNALTYHWINSDSQKALLKALNIDSRNILYGPRWNASMPRFAANLGFAPLEPMRTELPTPSQPPAPPPEQNQSDIPAANFDWTSAGLTNPLDSDSQANTMLLDLEQFGNSFDISQSSLVASTNSPIDLDSWDYWLKCQQSDETKNETEDLTANFTLALEVNKQFDSVVTTSCHLEQSSSNNFGKLAHSDTESVNSLKFIEASADLENEIKGNSDNCSLDKVSIEDTGSATFTDFTSVQLFSTESVQMPSFQAEKVSQGESSKNSIPQSDSNQSINEDALEDDDFTDFQMSLPVVDQPTVALEPLKPVVLDTALVATSSHQINWPEPGIVSEELDEIDFNFVCSAPKEVQNPPIKIEPVAEKREERKVVEEEAEEDWSDFVSAQGTSKKSNPLNKNLPHPSKTQNNNKTKNLLENLFQNTTKPAQQLELSVPNLQNTQIKHATFSTAFMPNSGLPKSNLYAVSNESSYQTANNSNPYQISVHTINTPFGGLPQTSLSVYNNYSGSLELGSQPHRREAAPQAFKAQPEPGFQLQSIENTFLQMQSAKQVPSATLQSDDDDWTDFISSQPPANASNGLPSQPAKLRPAAPPTSSYSKAMLANWPLDLSPNIIANPVHFDVIPGYQAGSGLDNNDNCKKSQLKGKHSVPSISALPDLDFIAPKSKFFSKK